MKKYKNCVNWTVPVREEFERLNYLTPDEVKVLDGLVSGDKTIVSQCFDTNCSESTINRKRKNIIQKYKNSMRFSTILQDAWNDIF